MKRPWLLQPPKTEDETFKFVQFELFFLGCWTGSDKNRTITYFRGIVNFLINAISVVGQYAFAYVNRKKLILVLDCMCPATTMAVTSFKQIVLLKRTDVLNGIFEEIKEAFRKEVKEKGTWVREWIPLNGYRLTIFLLTTTTFTGSSFIVMQLVSNIRHMLKGDIFEVQLPFKSVWPFEYLVSPNYEIMYFYYWYAALVTQFGISAGDGLVLDIYLHVSALFKLVSYDLENLVQDCIGDHEKIQKFSREQNLKIYEKITKVMQKHQFCFDLCERVLALFGEIIFVHIASASLIICLSSMDLMLAEGLNKLIFVNYIIAATTQVFIYAMAGGHLEEMCLNVAFSGYDMPWYKMDNRTRGLILMLIRRGQKQVLIEAPFVTASMPTFASICQAAGSYVTMLKTFL